MYRELFKLCAWGDEEIEKNKDRIEKAIKMARLGPEDFKQAPQRVKKTFDLNLLAVRQCLGVYLRDFVDVCNAKEEGKKLVYAWLPGDARIPSIFSMSAENVYAVTPEIALFIVLGEIFDKLSPMLEAAEKHVLPPGIAACSMNQVALGAFLLEIFPRPDLIIGTSFFCDQTPKMEEVVSETFGIPVVYIDAPGDEAWGEYPETHPRKISYFGRELRQAINQVQEMGIFKMNATEEILHEVRVDIAKLWAAEAPILQLMKADPQPMSWVDLQVVAWQVFMPGPNTKKYMPDILTLLRKEVKERVDAGKGVVEKGGPTVLCFACSVADPEMTHLFEELGMHTPSQLFYWISPYEMQRAQYSSFEEKVAESHLKYAIHGGAYAVNMKMEAMIKEFKADGVLLYYPLGCRPTVCWPYVMKKYIEQELKIPALVLEGDWGDKRSYTVGTSRTRVETFAEMLKAAKEAREAKAAEAV